jgi:hypothetical protein
MARLIALIERKAFLRLSYREKKGFLALQGGRVKREREGQK